MALATSKTLSQTGGGGEYEPPLGSVRPTLPTYTFMIALKPGVSGRPTAYFSRQDIPRAPSDGPADIRIKQECRIDLKLDPNCKFDFEFRKDKPMTLVQNDDCPGPRYERLPPTMDSTGQICIGISFNAVLHLPASDYAGNLDPYNLYFNVYFRDVSGNRIKRPLTLRFDPDIKNPGDDGIELLGI
jgi:hypothetical protein